MPANSETEKHDKAPGLFAGLSPVEFFTGCRHLFKTFFIRDKDVAHTEQVWYERLYQMGCARQADSFQAGKAWIATQNPREFFIRRNGTTLCARLYEPQGEAKGTFLLSHGFHSFPEHDFAPIIPYLIETGYRALAVDQRAHGKSGGKYLTYGWQERYDLAAWSRFLEERGEKNIYLWGISMGGASALLAAALPEMSPNLLGVVDDCGYSSLTEEFVGSMKRHKMDILYPTMRKICRFTAHFDPDDIDAAREVPKIRVPVLFIHGTDDRLIPHFHGVRNYEACVTPKKLVLIPGAGHGLAFATDGETYKRELAAFLASLPDNKANPS